MRRGMNRLPAVCLLLLLLPIASYGQQGWTFAELFDVDEVTPVTIEQSGHSISVVRSPTGVSEVALFFGGRRSSTEAAISNAMYAWEAIEDDADLGIFHTFDVTLETKDSSHPLSGIGSNLTFALDDVQAPNITLYRGKLYRFRFVDDLTSEPFYLSLSSIGAGASPYTDASVSGDTSEIRVLFPPDSPDEVFYQSVTSESVGSGMAVENFTCSTAHGNDCVSCVSDSDCAGFCAADSSCKSVDESCATELLTSASVSTCPNFVGSTRPERVLREVTVLDDESIPSPRTEHASAAIESSQLPFVVVFGGLREGESDEQPADTGVYVFDNDESVWSSITPAGGPGARMGHTMVTLKDDDDETSVVVVFGGFTSAGELSNETWSMSFNATDLKVSDAAVGDISTSWTQLATAAVNGPVPRAYHCAAQHPTLPCMYIFGGIDASDTVLGDVWEYCLFTDTWTEISSGHSTAGFERYQHTCGFYTDGQMFGSEASELTVNTGASRLLIFGGRTANDSVTDSFVLYDTEERSGFFVPSRDANDSTNAPSPRANHGAAVLGNEIHILGGENTLSIINESFVYVVSYGGECGEGQAGAFGSDACTNCSEGAYSPISGLYECEPCPSGTFTDLEGQTTCEPCAAGTFALLASGETGCANCPSGTFRNITGGYGVDSCFNCTAGTYNNAFGQTSCTNCPSGTSTDGLEGAVLRSQCESCTEGQYAPAGTPVCLECPSGTFSPASGQSQCTNCAIGRFASSEGSSFCSICSAGSFSNTTKSTSCTSCSPGYFQPNQHQSSCIGCLAGTYQPAAGKTSCISCPAGRAGTAVGGASLDTACPLCGAGEYQNLAGQEECNKCPAGRYSNATGATSISTCLQCPEGTNGGAVIGGTSILSCTGCPAGFYGFADTLECVPCDVGTASSEVGATSSAECSSCPPNTYSGLGSSTCAACPAGTFSGSNFESCMNCTRTSESLTVDTDLVSPETCSEWAELRLLVPDGVYPLSGLSDLQYCDQETDGGGWHRVVNFKAVELTDATSDCPGGWSLRIRQDEPRVCYRNSAGGNCRSAFFETFGRNFTQIRGRVKVYQYGIMGAFRNVSIEDNYVDGVSITVGDTGDRTHIWTYGIGSFEDRAAGDGTSQNNCPCAAFPPDPEGDLIPPLAVGNDYFCDSGSVDDDQVQWYTRSLFQADQCQITTTCCDDEDLPYFQRNLGETFSGPIEVRICADESSSIEDVWLAELELLVREDIPNLNTYQRPSEPMFDGSGWVRNGDFAREEFHPSFTASREAAYWNDFGVGYALDNTTGKTEVGSLLLEFTGLDPNFVLGASQEVIIDLQNPMPFEFQVNMMHGPLSPLTNDSSLLLLEASVTLSFVNGEESNEIVLPFRAGDATDDVWQARAVSVFPEFAISKALVLLKFQGYSGSVWVDDVAMFPVPQIACDCTEGYYYDVRHNTTEQYCPSGMYCAACQEHKCSGDLFSFGGQAACEECPSNWLCIDGVGEPCFNTTFRSGTECIECPTGSFCENGRTGLCPAGTYGTGGLCISCLPGTYAATSGSSQCIPCAAGQTSNYRRDGCAACRAGEFSDGDGICQSCSPGTFQSLEGQSECLDCPPGTNTTEFASRGCASCESAVCALDCFNGGVCGCDGVCACSGTGLDTGYEGEQCEIPVCSDDPFCNNCTSPDTCSGCNQTNYELVTTASRTFCSPECDPPCQNGGACISPGDPSVDGECECIAGSWNGTFCEIPVCPDDLLCLVCDSPGVCGVCAENTLPNNETGKCEPVCNPSCQNRGVCTRGGGIVNGTFEGLCDCTNTGFTGTFCDELFTSTDSSAKFNGASSKVAVSIIPEFGITTLEQSFSIAMFFQTSSSGSRRVLAHVYASLSGTGDEMAALITSSGHIEGGIRDNHVDSGALFRVRSAETVNDGEWHHTVLGVERSNGQIQLFVDGCQVDFYDFSSAYDFDFSPTDLITFGAYANNTGYFDGYMGDVRVYVGSVYDPTNSTDLYSVVGIDLSTLIARYRMDSIATIDDIDLFRGVQRGPDATATDIVVESGAWTVINETVPTPSAVCRYGYITFGGANTYIEVPRYSTLNWDDSDYAVSVWIRLPRTGRKHFILSRGGERNGESFAVGVDDGNPFIFFNQGDDSDSGSLVMAYRDIANSVWHHVLVTKNRQYMYVYVDGCFSVYGQLSCGGFCNFEEDDTIPLLVGKSDFDAVTEGYFTGDMADLRVYTRTRNGGNTDVIGDLLRAGDRGFQLMYDDVDLILNAELVLRFRFHSKHTDNTIYNEATGSNDGIIHGSTGTITQFTDFHDDSRVQNGEIPRDVDICNQGFAKFADRESGGHMLMNIITANDGTRSFDSGVWQFQTDNYAYSFFLRTNDTRRATIYSAKAQTENFDAEVYTMTDGRIGYTVRGTNDNNYDTVETVSDVSDGIWHHIILTRIGETYTFYIDGCFDSTVTTTRGEILDSGQYNRGEVGIGAHVVSGYRNDLGYLSAHLADFRLYIGAEFTLDDVIEGSLVGLSWRLDLNTVFMRRGFARPAFDPPSGLDASFSSYSVVDFEFNEEIVHSNVCA